MKSLNTGRTFESVFVNLIMKTFPNSKGEHVQIDGQTKWKRS